MKLVVAVVRDETVGNLTDALTRSGFQATKLASTGGFLKAGNSTLLIGVKADDVPRVLEIIKASCPPRKVLTGDLTFAEGVLKGAAAEPQLSIPNEVSLSGATVFVLDVEQAIKF